MPSYMRKEEKESPTEYKEPYNKIMGLKAVI